MGLVGGLGLVLVFSGTAFGCFRSQRHGWALCSLIALAVSVAYIALLFMFAD